jgi:imidazolonepropionase-like amidohydrolase
MFPIQHSTFNIQNFLRMKFNIQNSTFKIFLTWIAIFFTNILVSQTPIPAKPQSKSILLMGGTAHLGNGKVIQNSAIGIKDGKLTLVADATTIKLQQGAFDETIDIHGKQVYPGFINPNTTLGLQEIEAVRSTRDFAEVGGIVPHVRSEIAYNTDSKIIPTVRANGVLLAQIVPRAGRITGTSSVMELDGWNWEDAVYKADDGVHLNWPAMFSYSGWWAEPGGVEKNKEYDRQVNDFKKFFRDSKAYNEGKVEEKNLRFEAMKGIFKGTQNLYIHVDYVKEISEAVNFSKENGVKHIVLVGAKDAYKVIDLLKENNVSVIVSRVHELPEHAEDDVDQPFKLPGILQKEGILFCLNIEGNMDPMEGRNLPFQAGTAATYGLGKEGAVTAITLNTARILGIDKSVGSLEVGKDATLFVSTGDALDMRTNNVEHAFIRGKSIDLNTEQKELYKRYSTKYGQAQ